MMTNDNSLALFIRDNISAITQDWERFATTLTPAADSMTHLALRDHIKEILEFIADDIQSAQSKSEQKDKAEGAGDNADNTTIGAVHGYLRFGDGFDIMQMVAEYRALRASIINLWNNTHKSESVNLNDFTRFNESIDQLVAESLRRFMERLDHSRDLILGVIGHDIRNPLGAMKMCAELLPLRGSLNDKQDELAAQIVRSSLRINQIVGDLIDLTRARTGTELPIRKTSADMGAIAVQIVTEMKAQNPTREILLETGGNVEGEWDSTRLEQVLSNLLGNAVQYSHAKTPINVNLSGSPDGIIIAVHNLGTPIPAQTLGKIFDFSVRAEDAATAQNIGASMHMGLGLYIVKQIVLSHGGEISVTSLEKEGTTFTVRLPKISHKIVA